VGRNSRKRRSRLALAIRAGSFQPVSEPARWGRRRAVLDLFDKAHLARPAVRAYELALAVKSAPAARHIRDDTGLPLPPARLRVQVGPLHADAEFFLRSGEHNADLVRSMLHEQGTAVEELGALLDWGCGCGRILRHWTGLDGVNVYGCDIDSRMVAWCSENLPFADVTVNALTPPLPYGDSSFDLVYAFSVMTHLSEGLQNEWLLELHRVLRPGGYLIFSTLGEYYASHDRLTPAERESFEHGHLVVLYERSAGTSLCSAYHPAEYVRHELARALDHVAFRAAADDGRHDIHLLRKPA
jgi:SAM-dependent methyltransferase